MLTPAVRYDKELIESTIANVENQFHDQVDRIRYSVREDWAGDPGLFFRIVLNDEAVRPKGAVAVRRKALVDLSVLIQDALEAAVNGTGLQPYFYFRTVSEQKELRDLEWE